MDGGNDSGPSKNALIVIIVSSVAAPLAFRLAAVLGELDWLEQVVEDQILALSLAVALLAFFREARR